MQGTSHSSAATRVRRQLRTRQLDGSVWIHLLETPRCGNGGRIIHIACPAPFVYQNEAHNSWALIRQRSGIDPYGQGNPSEQTFCDRYR